MAQYLQKRGNQYYFRRRVPEDVAPHIRKKTWKWSLRTGDKFEAEIRCRQDAVKTDKVITDVRSRLQAEREDGPRMWIDESGQLKALARLPFGPQPSGRTISHVFEEYAGEGGLAESSEEMFRLGVSRFIEVCGDKDVVFITRYDVEEFRNVLRRVPSRPPNKIRDLPITEQAIWADSQDAKRLAHGTVTRNMQGVSLTLDYAFNRTASIVDRTWTNPFKGFLTKDPKSQRKKRLRFSEEQVAVVFSPDVYQAMDTPARFWLPLLLLFTGARLDEVAQCILTEICSAPIPYIDLDTEEARTAKTESGRRYVPLHSQLIELGFLEYVDHLRRSGEYWLFPDLSHERGKERAAKTSRHFMETYRKFGKSHPETGLTNPRIQTHSLRHRFEHVALKAGVPLWAVDLFVGHHVGELGVDVYADELRRDPEAMKTLILDHVPFPDVNSLKQLKRISL